MQICMSFFMVCSSKLLHCQNLGFSLFKTLAHAKLTSDFQPITSIYNIYINAQRAQIGNMSSQAKLDGGALSWLQLGPLRP